MPKRVKIKTRLTDAFQKLVALVQNEHLEVLDRQRLSAGEVKDATWGADDDVRGLVTLEHLDLLFDGLATVDNFGPDVLHELREAVKLLLDLVRELAIVTQNKGGAG